MKKLNKKIFTIIGSTLGVALIALCLFCSLQNKHDYKAPDSESSASSSSSIVAANAFEQTNQSLAKTDAVVTNTNNNSNSADSNDNKAIEPKTKTHNDNVVKYEELWAEGYELPANVCSSEDPGVTVYYKYKKNDDGTYKVLISNSDLGEETKSFDSADPAPWVNPTDKSAPKQENISEVEIQGNVVPTNTIGWFGCQTDDRQYAHLSRINKISGLDNLDMSNVKNASYMFCGSNQIESVDATDTFFSNIKQVDNAFGICNYTSLSNEFINKIAQAICTTARNTSWAFAHNTKNLKSFVVLDTESQVTNADFMFYQDKSLRTITAVKLISAGATVNKIFYDCGALKTINLEDETNWSNTNVSGMELFTFCWSLEGPKGTKYADQEESEASSIAYAKTDKGKSSNGYFSVRNSLVQIDIKQKPEKLKYEIGEGLDPSGMIVQATYEDQTYKNVTDSVVWTPTTFDEIGKQIPVTVSFTDKETLDEATCSFNVEVEFTLKNLTVDGHQYYPVAGDSLSKDITFYDAKKSCYPNLAKTKQEMMFTYNVI